MAFRIVPYGQAETSAVAAFNARLAVASPDGGFPLPAEPLPDTSYGHPPIAWTHYLAVDREHEVRGGFLLMDQKAWLSGQTVRAVNYQSPVSEGIWDPRFSFVAMTMLKEFQRRSPCAFIVGMGAPEKPLPRLLRAGGWRVEAVPFLFRLFRPGPVLQELSIFRQSPWLARAADVAVKTGLAAVGNRLITAGAARGHLASMGCAIHQVDEWGPWADFVWTRVRDTLTFAAVRDREALKLLYPEHDERYRICRIEKQGQTIGWTVSVLTRMENHQHFGNLSVGTVLDGLALHDHETAVASLTVNALADAEADLVITNQSLASWQRAYRSAGLVVGPSNYLLATAPALTAAATERGQIHVVRGDGDGRVNL